MPANRMARVYQVGKQTSAVRVPTAARASPARHPQRCFPVGERWNWVEKAPGRWHHAPPAHLRARPRAWLAAAVAGHFLRSLFRPRRFSRPIPSPLRDDGELRAPQVRMAGDSATLAQSYHGPAQPEAKAGAVRGTCTPGVVGAPALGSNDLSALDRHAASVDVVSNHVAATTAVKGELPLACSYRTQISFRARESRGSLAARPLRTMRARARRTTPPWRGLAPSCPFGLAPPTRAPAR
jgi:hypothetical protein